VSHEIRTPLNGIVASADLLLREPNLPPDAATYARLIAESGGLLVSLIGDVLDFSKIEADRLELEIQPFTLARLIDDSNAVAKTQAAGKGVTLRTEVSPDVAGQYLGDRLRLSQVLINLLSNAVKFTDEGGTIDLHVSSIDPKADPASLRFAVRDSGIGMDESTRSRVFERFTQADTSTTRRYGGTGLGLPISARLVAMMGGQLEVDSAVGHGSTFGFTIPLPVCTDAPAALPSPDRPFAALGLRVLVAEDNAINQRILAAQLAKLGCTFTLTADGEEVLNALNQGPLPDVILMDCHMPRLDGWATTARIRSHPADPANTDHGDQLRSLPIIALTAVARPEDRDRCFASGMSGFLSKPIQLTELHHALEPFVTPEN
jgi:CheY-like chemotaxis protein/anti-sigma regulatory factor (Ser/Thr protein kinase)